jgi:chloramphenicol-sensitive protein RarD
VNKGILSALAAYLIWGIFPLYWKMLTNIPAMQIMTHRVVWSFLFVVVLISLRRDWTRLRSTLNRRTLLIYLLAGVLLAVNWTIYIWSVNAGFILESSLGYFINPLVSVLLGVVFLREKLRPWQWFTVGLAALGVLYLTITHGSLPWISLALACTFGLYGFIKKQAPLGSLTGLTLETALIFLPALGFLLVAEANGTGAFGHLNLLQSFLLIFTGVVTAVPLLLFSEGARRIPLAMLGLLQYVSPTMQFLLGVLLYHEAFTHERVIGFSIIWLALIIYSAEGLLVRQRTLRAAPAD